MNIKNFLYNASKNQSSIQDNESDNISIAANNILIKNFPVFTEDISDSYSDVISISTIKTDESDVPNKNRMPNFIVGYLKKKRGRKITNITKKVEHLSSSPDNILSKIQIHFLNFITNLSNDYIYAIIKTHNCNFKNLNSSFKAKISRVHFEKTKNLTIKQIFERVDISEKYKKDNKDINKKTLLKLSYNPMFQKLFDMKFMDLFNYYYNDGQPLKEIFLSGKKIKFSEKTKTFYDLLEKYKDLEQDMLQIIKMFYLEDFKDMKSNEKSNPSSNNDEYNH